MEFINGQIYPVDLRKIGNSYYLLVTPAMLAYMEFDEKELEEKTLQVILKADHSPKHDHPYFGMGKRFKK